MKKKSIITKILNYFREHSVSIKKKEAEGVKRSPKTEEFERCIICGALTCVPISMPINFRENYEVGCGQLCAKCAERLQGETRQANALSYEQVISAVEKRKEK